MPFLTVWHFSAGLASPFYLNFRVRFFISDPNSLQHEQTRLVHVPPCYVCFCGSHISLDIDLEKLYDSQKALFAGIIDINEGFIGQRLFIF